MLLRYAGGLIETPAARWREKFPERILLHAVRGMLPKNTFRLPRLARLKIFPGEEHLHSAQFPQQPEKVTETKAMSVEELQPMEGLTDSWDFPPGFPEWRKKEIWTPDSRKKLPK